MASSTSKDAKDPPKIFRKDQLEKWIKTTNLMSLDEEGIEFFIEAIVEHQEGPECDDKPYMGDLIRRMRKNPAKDVECLKKCLNSSNNGEMNDYQKALISNAEKVSDYFNELWEPERREKEEKFQFNFKERCVQLKETSVASQVASLDTPNLMSLDEEGIELFIKDFVNHQEGPENDNKPYMGDLIRQIRKNPAKDVEYLKKCLNSSNNGEMNDYQKALISNAEKVSDYFNELWEEEKSDLEKKFDEFKKRQKKSKKNKILQLFGHG